tara:strand:+ start:297 stop:830 length:534 start_codon:yes stop_codon:yes gene_type:complete
MERWEYFSETAFVAMQAQIERDMWSNAAPQKKISQTRIFYDQIHSCGYPNQTDYISMEALKLLSKKKRPTKDHILAPQFVARMVYDNPDKWLTDYAVFKDLFFKCCQTIQVTREENDILKTFTSNHNNQFSLYCNTVDRYENAGIALFDGKQFVDNKIFQKLVPEELTEYELPYLIK